MNKTDERDKRLRSHRWSGWPGAYCQDCFIQDCFIDDPLERAVADNVEDTDKWDCPECDKGKITLKIGNDYSYRGEIVRYVGKGRHTGQLMFRDTASGVFIFIEESSVNTYVTS